MPQGVVLFCCSLSISHAAGGHFAVDDAAILDVGQCELESWLEVEGNVTRSLLHLGPACRVGPVELALNVDRFRAAGQDSTTVAGPQVKWARAFDDRLSVGIVGLVGWSAPGVHYAGASAYVPISLSVAPWLTLHANAGRDWFDAAPSSSRAGAAVEWQASRGWAWTGEFFHQLRGNFGRLGTRWQASEDVSIDVSRAVRLDPASGGWWSLGANWSFEARSRRP